MIVQVLSKKELFLSIIVLFFFLCLICLNDSNEKKPENVQITAFGTALECTFVNELLSVGFSEDEALQNIHSCKDRECPYHYPRLYFNLALDSKQQAYKPN